MPRNCRRPLMFGRVLPVTKLLGVVKINVTPSGAGVRGWLYLLISATANVATCANVMVTVFATPLCVWAATIASVPLSGVCGAG